MTTLLPQLYIAAVTAAGFAIGLYLHLQLKKNDQITIKAPSPFRDYAHRTDWFAHEVGAHA